MRTLYNNYIYYENHTRVTNDQYTQLNLSKYHQQG